MKMVPPSLSGVGTALSDGGPHAHFARLRSSSRSDVLLRLAGRRDRTRPTPAWSSARLPAASSAIRSAGGRGKVAATAIGAVVGGIVGSEIGRSMDQQDRMLAQQAEFDALERGQSGQSRQWRNPDNGRYGEVIPSRPYKRGALDCRDFTHKIYIDGQSAGDEGHGLPQSRRHLEQRRLTPTGSNVGLTSLTLSS